MRVIAALFLLFFAGPAIAQDSNCRMSEAGRALDFWLGDWTVYQGNTQIGVNGIQLELGGCAVFEHWTNSAGNEGKSLFYFDAAADIWQQVWVTEDTGRPGGLKLKQMTERGEGMARFEGELEHPTRGAYLDRTTLTLQPNGDVRQLIEISFDGGTNWQQTFDGTYKRVETP